MKAWHFVKEDRKLNYNDNRIVKTGRTYKVPEDRPLKLCDYGLHGAKRIIDALKYAPGPVICRVELLGEILHDTDKSVAYERKVLWMRDISKELRYFARLCALDVIHLWDAPDVVMRFLKTGDESIRDAARLAARLAAHSAANWAARSAAHSAAHSAAYSAAHSAAYSAADSEARFAAHSAAHSAARLKQNDRLTRMVNKNSSPLDLYHEDGRGQGGRA